MSNALREILDSARHEPCKDCEHYKKGYSFADGFQCSLAKTKRLKMPGYIDPIAWIGAVCIYDERLEDLRKINHEQRSKNNEMEENND